ncbi:MAG: hypothetical protein ACLP53_13500 [Isosphaeraceae bacterium]
MILRRIGILSLGKFFCFWYGLTGLLLGALVSLASLLGAALNGRGPVVAMLGVGVGAIIVFRFFTASSASLPAIGATLFNLVASMVGGIEIELSRGNDPPARSPARPDPYLSDPVTTPGERNPGFHS